MSLTLVVHNVGSMQRLVDTVKAAFAFEEVKLVVVTRPYGAAAQAGVPEAQKISFKRGRGFMVLPDLSDALELLRPSKIYTLSWEHGRPVDSLEPGGTDTMVVVGATDPGLTKQEALLGEPVYPAGVSAPLGPVAEAALAVYMLSH
jgi:SpoU rRNA methylase family enzyme